MLIDYPNLWSIFTYIFLSQDDQLLCQVQMSKLWKQNRRSLVGISLHPDAILGLRLHM